MVTQPKFFKPREISNPFSTGGGGTSYEQRVAAFYMVSLLAQIKPLGLPTGITQWIGFQSRHLGATVDDLLVKSSDSTDAYHIQLQVKHDLTFTGNPLFQEVIADAWFAFTASQGLQFDPERDRIGLVVPSYSQKVAKHLLELLKRARTNSSARDFIRQSTILRQTSAEQREYLALFRVTLGNAAGATVTDEQIWKFLRCFVVLRLELETEGSVDTNNAWNTLLNLLPNKSSELAHAVFNTLIKLAGEFAPQAGRISLGSLQGHLYREIPSLRTHQTFFDDLELELQKVVAVYVPPAEYSAAKIQLERHKFVILTGPAHIGKTATAFHLALATRGAQGNLSIIRVSSRDNLNHFLGRSECIFILDDCFGSVNYSQSAHGESLHRILGLSKSNYVIITSRTEVYAQAQQETRLDEYPEVTSARITLQQDSSYGNERLVTVLRNHLGFMQSVSIPEQDRLSLKQIAEARQYEENIVQGLRFPHNIDIFCRVNLKRVGRDISMEEAIEQSKKIEQVVQSWAKRLPENHRWFVFLVALLPGITHGVLQGIYGKVSEKFNFPVDDAAFLVKSHYAFLANSQRPQFSHPSYEHAMISLLRDTYSASIGGIVDAALRQVLLADTLALGFCDNADYAWPRTIEGQPFDIGLYLNQFIEAYNHLIHSCFTSIRESLPPYRSSKAAALFLLSLNNTRGELSLVPTNAEGPFVISEQPTDISGRIDDLMNQAKMVSLPIDFWGLQIKDLRQRSPQLHAFSNLRDNVNYVFKRRRLREVWPLLHYRVESALRQLSLNLVGIVVSSKGPFTSEMVELLCQEFREKTEQRPDGWPEVGWTNMIISDGRQLVGLNKAIKSLEQLDRKYDGPLLVQSDLKPSRQSHTPWSLYSCNQMRIAIARFFDLAFTSYREMAELNFPALISRFGRYQHGPIKVLGALTYKSHFGSIAGQFYFLPADFPLISDGNYELHVECDLESNDPVLLPFDLDVQKRLEQAKAASSLESMVMGANNFISGRNLIELVYEWLKADLDKAMSWQAVGSIRQRYEYQRAAVVDLPPQHSFYWDMHQSQDLRQIFDWPELAS